MTHVVATVTGLLLALAVTSGCGGPHLPGASNGASGAWAAHEAADLPPLPRRLGEIAPFPASEAFDRHVEKHRDLTYQGLVTQLGPQPADDRPLSFDPTEVRHYDLIAKKLQLTNEERALYRKQGVVGVDHGQRYSMASAYYAIYARDMPVLVTGDSVLHALHRSYDQILKELETAVLLPLVDGLLKGAHQELARRASEWKAGALADSAADVDVYLTVARRLLQGAGEDADAAARRTSRAHAGGPAPDEKVERAASKLGNGPAVQKLLDRVASLELQAPPKAGTTLNGSLRHVDYSQFRPRGHYTESETLERYFRALMWLGRPDLGFVLSAGGPESGGKASEERALRGAALLAWLLKSSGGQGPLGAMNQIVDFMVGRSDSLTAGHMITALDRAAVSQVGALESAATLARVREALAALKPPPAQIRSTVLRAPVRGSPPVPLPQVMQLFGQRFVLDSFVLSRVVFDSIQYREEKVMRMMPAGLDVMAALGNDEAVHLLEPELRALPYATNLLAARKVVDEHTTAHWQQNLYMLWLDALRTLDDAPEAGAIFPEVMRRLPWRRKQLQTQLGSWAELRHDTILYAQQSYTAFPDCEYPDGFVEPYPELFFRLRFFAAEVARLLAAADVALADGKQGPGPGRVLKTQVTFLKRFEKLMGRLESLARKELRAQPFSDEERGFLKATIDIRGGGSGAPTYDGWYPQLIYGDDPAEWAPTVADVHTDPASRKAREVAVGNVNFLVVAIDNQGDRAAYVGAVFSYYEFTQPVSKRLTDQEWQRMVGSGDTPARPAWTGAFQAPRKIRELGPPDAR